MLNLIPLEVRIIDFDRSCLTSDTQKGSALGTPGYFPEAHIWQDGNMKWDKWAFVAILCEADMPLDEYFSTKKESDCKH